MVLVDNVKVEVEVVENEVELLVELLVVVKEDVVVLNDAIVEVEVVVADIVVRAVVVVRGGLTHEGAKAIAVAITGNTTLTELE